MTDKNDGLRAALGLMAGAFALGLIVGGIIVAFVWAVVT